MLGEMFIDGQGFCQTLEDIERPTKIYGETAIPVGTYRVVLTYSAKFRRVMPLLLGVPGFVGILIHNGNTNKDTKGCILVGIKATENSLKNSRSTFIELMKRLTSVNKTEKIYITIKH